VIGHSTVSVDETSDITIKGKWLKGTKGLWEIVRCKNINNDLTTMSDLKRYKNILYMTDAHLVGYEPGGDIQISGGPKFDRII
jgi:hypothetical protein